MKKIIFPLLIAILALSCNNKGIDYKYKIVGKVSVNDTLKDAIAYTDTIHGCNKDSIWYYNSDGSKLTLLPPYQIYKLVK